MASMRRLQLAGLAALLGLPVTALLPLSSCSSGNGAGSGPMYIETCTLGCSNGQGGLQVSCTIVDVAQNVEITVLFSEAVNLSTVNASSFRITNTLNGSSPVGTFTLDPLDARRLIFRPALTFDAVGNPIFALDPNQTYEVLVPGVSQGDTEPLVHSQAGKQNETRLRCTINTTQALLDPVPGPPTATSAVVVTHKDTAEVLEVFDPADGAVGVPVGGGVDDMVTQIVTTFDDIMNPATLANLSTGQSSNIRVQIDVDGDIVTTDDRVEQSGTFAVEVSFEQLKTFLTFTPIGGFPSGGSEEAPRKIVLTLPVSARDLVGNELENPGETAFQTVVIDFPELVLPVPDPDVPGDEPGEQFQNQNNLDADRSGANWGNNRLTFGVGGGTGRHGALVVPTGEVVVLDADSQDFPYVPDPSDPDATGVSQIYDLMDNVPVEDYTPTDRSTWPILTSDNGAFEFTQLIVRPGATLRVHGLNPARLFSRGPMIIDGVLDISGGSASAHLSNTGNEAAGGLMTALGGTGGTGGPNGGNGGDGGDRFNHGMNALPPGNCPITPMTNAGGIVFPDPQPPGNPGVDNDGAAGGGVGQSLLASGLGGSRWPTNPPKTLNVTSQPCFGNAVLSTVPAGVNLFNCRIAMVGGAGAGGGYALDGGDGLPVSPEEGLPTTAPAELTPGPSTGGASDDLGLELPGSEPALVRKLDFVEGNLRGGSGGGGGGMSVYGTKTIQNPTQPDANCLAQANLFPYWDHSAAGGGGGGGAVQLVSGTRLIVGFNGLVDAHGGDGGSSTAEDFPITNCTDTPNPPGPGMSCTGLAAPGGGGAGGAVRMQSLVVDIAAITNRVSVEGGLGGVGSTGSLGGDGSPGLVRIEKGNLGDIQAEAAVYAPSIAPYLPGDPEFNDPFPSAAILSIGAWEFQRNRPDSLNASMSCWMIPEGNFFELDFLPDLSPEDNPDNSPDGKGWNMDILYTTDTGVAAFPYRGIPDDPEFPLGSMDFQEFLQNLINSDEAPGDGSLIAVRFQGARSATDILDPCDVELGGVESDIQQDSLTRWVTHPDELDLFFPRPNMVRFCVVFEENLKAQGPTEFRIQGVTNLHISVQPN